MSGNTTTAPAWSSRVAYRTGWRVSSGGSTYRCILAHTNHKPPDVTYWVDVASDITPPDEFLIAKMPNTRAELHAACVGLYKRLNSDDGYDLKKALSNSAPSVVSRLWKSMRVIAEDGVVPPEPNVERFTLADHWLIDNETGLEDVQGRIRAFNNAIETVVEWCNRKRTPSVKPKRRRSNKNTERKPLTERQKLAVELFAEHRGDYEKIGEAMGISRQGAMKHVAAGFKKLDKRIPPKPKTTSIPTDERGQDSLSDFDSRMNPRMKTKK